MRTLQADFDPGSLAHFHFRPGGAAPRQAMPAALVGVLVWWDRGKTGDPTAARPKGGVDQFQVESECKVPERP
jgi:hypothetical protein